ncbi:MAG TPA: sulfatase, partial [Myxococcota bacterium]|nr:sulfatase [Myxococcota bacterium]
FLRWKTGATGLLAGGFGNGGLALALAWFEDPPPFQEPYFLQGNPLVFVAGVGLVGLVAALLRRAGLAPNLGLWSLGLLGWALSRRSVVEPPAVTPPAGAPNILVVTLDTTRADRLGAYGNEKVDTRNFDQLAREGTLFMDTSAVAAVTGPSHSSMFTGNGPWEHGVLLNGVPIPEDRPMLAELLHDGGWRTAAFVSAYVLDGKLGFARGFQVYDDDFSWFRGLDGLLPARTVAMALRRFSPDEVLERRSVDTVDLALHWIKSQDQTWMAWVHLFDPHGPYDPPPPYDTRYYAGDPRDPAHHSMEQVTGVAPYLKASLQGITDVDYVIAQYEGELSYTDSQLGRLLEAVDRRTTLVVVIGDHGESLGEHGVWFNHGDDVYESSVHVPFVIRWPGQVPEGVQVTSPVEGTDLAPTVLDLVGLPIPSTMSGRSAARLAEGQGQPRSMAHSMCFDRQANQQERAAGRITAPRYRMVGIRGPTSRYVYQELAATGQYFDLKTDPLGVQDTLPTMRQSSQGEMLIGVLDEQARVLLGDQATQRSAVELSAEERARLEALGYLEQ